MISLTAIQEDALIEICNVGMSKAAKQLSILLNSHINILIPKITLIDIDSFVNQNIFSKNEILSYVYQSVSEDLIGRAILMFHRAHATLLTQSVIGSTPKLTEKEARACEQEAVLEVGNIMITSCMSAIVNMISLNIKLDMPHYNEGNLKEVTETQAHDVKKYSKEVILIATHLETAGKDISGSLLLMLTKESINNLLDGINNLLKI